MMLHNIAPEVKTNLAFDSKKVANFCKPFVSSYANTAASPISVSFSEATEDISCVKIQGFEANFLGKGEVFSEKSEVFSATAKFDNNLLTPQFNSSSQYKSFNIPSSAVRCLADSKVIANNNDLALPIFPISPLSNSVEQFHEEQLMLPGFSIANFSLAKAPVISRAEPANALKPEASNPSISSNFSESMNLPDEPPGNMPLSSSALNYQINFDPANQVRYCPSKRHTCFSSHSFTSGSDLISEASSDHLLEMINCLIEEAQVSKLAEKARNEELPGLRKEVDHLKQTNQAILIYLEVLQKSIKKSQQIF